MGIRKEKYYKEGAEAVRKANEWLEKDARKEKYYKEGAETVQKAKETAKHHRWNRH